jgi:2-amino-4-hydroxy-6-hydroxymethyldihydropteridine diphosphokinase
MVTIHGQKKNIPLPMGEDGRSPGEGNSVKVYIGLGSNLGDRKENLNRALEHLRIIQGVHVLGVSTYVDTRPLGIIDQPDYLNAVAVIDTTLEPVVLLDELLHIEKRLGRVRRERWGPRLIDLDILTFGDVIVDHPRLKIPHPELQNRPFLLEGIKELNSALTPTPLPAGEGQALPSPSGRRWPKAG